MDGRLSERVPRTPEGCPGHCRCPPANAASPVGTTGSVLLVLSTSAFSPIPDLAISNGLRPRTGHVDQTTCRRTGTARNPVNAIAPGRFATERVRSLDASRGDPHLVRQQFNQPSRSVATVNRTSSVRWRPSSLAASQLLLTGLL